MKSYLTIDLDFWNGAAAGPTAQAFVRRVLALRVPTALYLHHHYVLRDLRREQFDRVVNIDDHDDLVWPDRGVTVDCGTWAGFVPGRRRMTYEWRYGSRCPGFCDSSVLPGFTTWFRGAPSYSTRFFPTWLDTYPKKLETVAGWRFVVRQRGLRGIRLDTVKRASIVLSPNFTCFDRVRSALLLLAEALKTAPTLRCSLDVRRMLRRLQRGVVPAFTHAAYKRSGLQPAWMPEDWYGSAIMP